jgi:hypothetical protein
VIKQSAVDVKKPKGKPQPVQSLLSTYFTGVKALKKDTPDELISMTRIPNDLYYGVKRIKPLSLIKSTAIEEQKTYYKQLGKMEECLPILDEMLVKESDAPGQSSLEGILMDPPWEYYVADGKNDGRCSYNITDFKNLMEKLIKHMSAGIIFVWVHKLIQGDIIRLMYELGKWMEYISR